MCPYLVTNRLNKILFLKDSKAGKIKTESGVWIPATYKSQRYAQWKERTKADQEADNDEDAEEAPTQKGIKSISVNTYTNFVKSRILYLFIK